MIENMAWFGNSSFFLQGEPSIMIDPYSVVNNGTKPDVILISHEDYDSCSPADVEKLRGEHTVVIASQSAARQLDGAVQVLRPWQVMNIGSVSIKAVPAYTYDGSHPAEREDLGFVISRNFTDIYYAGHTDFIPDMRRIRCDVAILPLPNRMSPVTLDGVVEIVKTMNPRYVVPAGNAVSKIELSAFERELNNHTTVTRIKNGSRAAVSVSNR